MRYLFTWNSSFLINESVKKWKDQFIEKYWDFNLIHINNLSENNINYLSEILLSQSFLAEKKLIIIDLTNELDEKISDFLINSLEKLPENNILLLSYHKPDKRQKLFKELKKYCDIKEFDIKDSNDTYNIIKNRYSWKIDDSAIAKLILYKSNNIEKIYSEIEKLLINSDNIKNEDIEKHIIPELEESIFEIIDNILNLKINDAIKKIEIILNQTNIYAFYNNLIANIRTNVYISKLKNNNIKSPEITKILNLWNRSFLVNKSYKINFNQLNKLYIRLINIDKKMKSWELIWTEEKHFRLELEKVLIKVV